ncbi:MAG: hypothetical protein KQH67_05675 [Bacteroidetes bacterium]|nr:hypothetical protein [Bacteroidota bacterium]
MVTIGGKSYKILQLDTNALSNILKEKDSKLKNLFDRFPPDKNLITYSPFTIMEISRNEYLLDRFCKMFSIIPSFFLKGYEQLRDEELQNYQDSRYLDILLLSPFDVKRPKGQLINEKDVHKLLTNKKLTSTFDKWENNKQRILEGMLSLKDNFQSKTSKYSKKEIQYFVTTSTFQQVLMYDKSFVLKNNLTDKNISLNNLQSFKIMSYSVFYKFYSDNRNPQLSDVFDILIGATIPYVDILITEKHYFDTIQKIKKQDRFLDNLKVYKVNEL